MTSLYIYTFIGIFHICTGSYFYRYIKKTKVSNWIKVSHHHKATKTTLACAVGSDLPSISNSELKDSEPVEDYKAKFL